MNKVDKLVKQMLIGFPTIFRHRFDVMCHLLACNGNGFEWHNGELVCVCSGRGGDKNPLAEFKAKVAENKKKLRKAAKCLLSLNQQYLANAEADLAYYQHVLDNIDVYATTYAGSDERDHAYFIFRAAHRDSLDYWLVNPAQLPSLGRMPFKIEDVDTEWKEAIQGWFKAFIPTMNGYMGVWNETTKEFDGVKPFEKFVPYIYSISRFYHSHPADIERERLQNKMAMDIINRIKARRPQA